MKLKDILTDDILLFALLISFIFGLPHILLGAYNIYHHSAYTPFSFNGVGGGITDETQTYAPLINDVKNGRLITSDAFVYEYRNGPFIHPPLPITMLGLLSRLLGSNAYVFILSDFLFPPLAFIALFVLLYLLTNNRLLSIAGGFFTIIGNHFVTSPQFLLKTLVNYGKGYSPLLFSRTPQPQLTIIFLILAIIFVYLTITKDDLRYSLIGGLFSGILFYVDPFYLSFFASGAFLLLIYETFIRNKNAVKRLLLHSCIATVISIPFWINFFALRNTIGFKDFLLRQGLKSNGMPDIKVTLVFVAIIAAYFYLYQKKDLEFYFINSFILGNLLLANSQVVTGFFFSSFRLIARVTKTWIIIAAVVLVNNFLKNKKFKIKKDVFSKCLTILIVFLILWGIYIQVKFSVYTKDSFTLKDTEEDLFSWLDKNTPADSVVMSDSFYFNSILLSYTHNKLFLPFGAYDLFTNNELFERLFITYRLYQVNESYIYGAFNRTGDIAIFEQDKRTFENSELAGYGYILEQDFIDVKNFTDDLTRGYKAYTFDSDSLSKYRLDYVIYGPHERNITNVNLSSYGFLTEVFRNKDFTVYKVVK